MHVLSSRITMQKIVFRLGSYISQLSWSCPYPKQFGCLVLENLIFKKNTTVQRQLHVTGSKVFQVLSTTQIVPKFGIFGVVGSLILPFLSTLSLLSFFFSFFLSIFLSFFHLQSGFALSSEQLKLNIMLILKC